MNSSKKSKEDFAKPIILSIGVFLVGYFMLEFSTKINIPPGQTFYVILGCILMAGALAKIYLLIKQRFFPKKKKKSKMFFMNEKNQKKTIEI